MTSIFVELITFMIFKLTWALIDIPVHVFGVQVGIPVIGQERQIWRCVSWSEDGKINIFSLSCVRFLNCAGLSLKLYTMELIFTKLSSECNSFKSALTAKLWKAVSSLCQKENDNH